MIKNDTSLLHEMLDDLFMAPLQYQPGNYWRKYVMSISNQLVHTDLNYFRYKTLGPGSISSLGGGSDYQDGLVFVRDEAWEW